MCYNIFMKHQGTKILTTKRLILRPIQPQDWEELFYGLRNQPEFLYYANKKRATKIQQKQSLENIADKYKNLDYYNWAITQKQDGKIVGQIVLKVMEINECVEFSYATDKQFWGKGYMTEALDCIINFAIKKIKVQRVQGGCAIENLASKKVMQKCNMHFEGTLKGYLHLADGYHDMHMFSITKQDFAQKTEKKQ